MDTITIPIIVTGSNGKKVTIPYAKVGIVEGAPEFIANGLLIATLEKMCASQEEGFDLKVWTPAQITSFEKDPENHVSYHGVTLEKWGPATDEARTLVKKLLDEGS